MTCNNSHCTNPAEVAVGVVFYPTKAAMKYYQSDAPAGRFILGLKVCRACCAQTTIADLMAPGELEKIAKVLQIAARGLVIDMDTACVVAVEFDDKDYVVLQKWRSEQ